MGVGGKWHVAGYHDAFWLLTVGALGEGVPKGAPLGARFAASLLDEWFPEGPGEATRADLLADICAEIDRGYLPDAQPPSRLKQTLARALADGRLSAYRIKADVVGSKRLELQDAEDTRPPEKVRHFVRFVVADQFGDELGDVKLGFRLRRGDDEMEKGKLGKDGKLEKDGVKKGIYHLDLQVLDAPTWSEAQVDEGKKVELRSKSPGFAGGTAGKIHVYDARGLAGRALATLEATVSGGVFKAEWEPDKETLEKATSSEVVFVAEVGGRRAMSIAVAARVKRVIEVELDGKKADNGTRVSARWSGGTTTDGTTTDGKLETLVGSGERLVSLGLPGAPAALVTLTPEVGDEHAYRLPGVA
jgi:hypothetical protein